MSVEAAAGATAASVSASPTANAIMPLQPIRKPAHAYGGQITSGGSPSKFQTIESDPQVRLRALLDVESLSTIGAGQRRGAPEGRGPSELSPELLGHPDLPGLDVRLDAHRRQHRRAAGDHDRSVSLSPT